VGVEGTIVIGIIVDIVRGSQHVQRASEAFDEQFVNANIIVAACGACQRSTGAGLVSKRTEVKRAVAGRHQDASNQADKWALCKKLHARQSGGKRRHGREPGTG